MWVRFPLLAPSRFSERSAVCKTACEGLIPSRLSASRARWTSTRLLSEPIRVRVPGGALFDCPCRLEARTSAPQAENAGAIPARDTVRVTRRGLRPACDLSLTCRMQAPVYEASCRGSTPRREAERFSVVITPVLADPGTSV